MAPAESLIWMKPESTTTPKSRTVHTQFFIPCGSTLAIPWLCHCFGAMIWTISSGVTWSNALTMYMSPASLYGGKHGKAFRERVESDRKHVACDQYLGMQNQPLILQLEPSATKTEHYHPCTSQSISSNAQINQANIPTCDSAQRTPGLIYCDYCYCYLYYENVKWLH